MAGAAGCFLRLRVCRVEARAEVPLIKLWGSLEDTKEEHRSQQSPQAAVFGEQSRPQAAAAVLLGELCLVEVSGEWQRCKVLLKRGAECEVLLLEEGTITSVSPTRLRKAQASLFFPLPPHTLVCALSGLVPPNGQHWNYSTLNYFYSLQDKVITGQVQDLLPQGLVLLEASEIAQQALLYGLAKTVPVLPSHPFLGCNSVTRHTPIPAMNGVGRGGPWQAESMDYCYPRLESGVTEQVLVTHVSKPHSIFCQLLSVAQEFHSLSEAMQHFYTVETGPAFRNPLKLGQPCASRGADGRWYRSLLQEAFQERQLATVIHVDWGREELVPLTCLRPLPAEFLRLPVITFRCALYGISDGGKDWELSVIAELRSLLQGKQVSATIQFFNSYKHLYVVTLLAADGCNLNYFFGMQVQNRSPKSDTCVIPSVAQASLCPEKDGEKIGTPKLPAENFYVPEFSTVELKTGTFYDAMVQYIFDPSNFYVQTEEDSKKHQEMVDFINNMYTKASRLEGIITKPKPGQICCAKFKDGIYYRAEVIACENKQVKVYFLDHGNVELIDWYSIKELPDEFKELSALANRCCLVDIYPLGESWSPEAICAFKVAVVHRKLVLYVMSKDLDKYAVEVLDQSRAKEKNVGKALSLAGHAKYEELETFTTVQIGESGGRKTTPSQPVSISGLSETEKKEATVGVSDDERLQYSPYEDQLFEPGATIKVIVSHIENPGLFWCQNAAQASALNNLMDSIQMYCILANTAPEPNANACFAKSPTNGTWYRGFISEIPVSETKSNSVQVLYVDYGMTEMVPAVNLRAMESGFFNVKTHAFKCSLYNIIAPLGNNPFCWDNKATNAFCDFAVKAAKGREFHCMFFATAFVDNELINIVDLYTPFENICANLAKRGFATYIFHKTLAPSVHLQSFYYSLHDIKTGSEEEVSITHVNPSLEFYCQLLKNTGTLARIAEAITKSCKKTQRLKLPSAVPLCLAKFTDQQWYRAFICSETDGAEVFFVDYGNTEKVAADDLQPIVQSEHDLLLLPMQAIKCSLSDIPLILPEEVMTWFEGIVWNRALRALVVAKEADGKLLVELYDGNEQINATLKSKLGLNVPKNALACKPAFCPSSQPSPKFTQQEAKTVNGERKTCESIQGQISHTRGSNVARTDSSTALPQRDRSSPGAQMPFEQQADRPALPQRDRSSPGTQMPFEQQTDRPALPQRDRSSPGTQMPFEQQTDRPALPRRDRSSPGTQMPFEQQADRPALPQRDRSSPGTQMPFEQQTDRPALPQRDRSSPGTQMPFEQQTDRPALPRRDRSSPGTQMPFEQQADRPALPKRDRSSPGTQMPFEQQADRPALPQRDRSSPGTQMPFEQHADRDYNANNREPSSQKRDTLPFQSNVKRALYQDNQDCSVRRKEVTKFQSTQRNSYYEQPSSQNSKPNFGKELHLKPNPFAKPCGSTPKHPLTKISEISTRSISPGEKLCVYASHAKNMFDFYVQTAETGLLDQISDFLNRDKSTFEEVSEKDVNIGDVVCALFDGDKLYYRGVVEQKSAVGLNVLYIDYGNTSVISNCKIYKLPQKLCSIPAQSIHCSLNSTKGASSVSNSHNIVEMFYERVFDQQLQCEFIKLKDDKWDVDLYDKRGSVNDLLKPLVEKGKVTTEFKARQEDVPVNKSFTWNVPKTGKTVKVFTSSVDSPGLFWCQLSTTDFDVLAKQVQEAGEKSVRDDHFIATIEVGSLCNVMYSEDQNWYRALVSKMEADVATVRFVDYGNVENVVKEEIRQLPTILARLPTQAFPCCLAKFNVAAGTWTSEGCDYFFQRATEDVLELTVEDIQHDEMCKIPLALVRLKYNEMDINEEMKRFWQVGKKESSNLAESASSKPDMTEERQTVEEKQLGAEELDWPIPSMEDEADHNKALDTCHVEPTVEWQTRPENIAAIKSFTWNVPKTGKTVKVFTSSVDSPGLFWCQLSTTDFDVLAKQVQEAGEKSVRDDHFIATIEVGSLCNVMYSEDQNWYRALVSKMEADVATVRFVDYGNVENVVKEEIRQLPTILARLPTQAFPCCLAEFNVAAGTWTSEGCDYFFQRATEDVLELTVEDIQHDEMCKIPLALVRLKYNEMDINEEMKRFWQVGKKEYSNLAESASSKPDMTEERQTVEEKQLGAEELDWPIPSMEDEADRNMGFDPLNTEETEDDTGDSSPRDLRQMENEEGISEEEGDQGIEHLVESKDDQAYERLVETITHKDTLAGDVFETGYECHGGLLVSYSSSLEYDDDYTKHECLAKEEFETEESATYKAVIESKEPIDDTLQDPTPEHVHKSEDTEKSKVFVLPNEKDTLEREKHSACACVENQVLEINEDATMQILATGVLAESENEDATNVDTVEAVVGEVEKSEEASVDSVDALEFSDTGVCEAVEAITYMNEEDFLAVGEHQEFEAITFVDHVEPIAISEHVEEFTYVDSTDALAIGEREVITFMDSVESITVGDIGECQEVEAMTHVDSVEAMFVGIDMNYDFDAITYVDMMEAVAVSEDIVEPVVLQYEEVEDIVEPVEIGDYAEVKDMVEPLVIGDDAEVKDIVEPLVIGDDAEVKDMVEPLVIGDDAEVKDMVEPLVIGDDAEVKDIVEPLVIGDDAEIKDIVEPLVIGDYEEVENRVEPIVIGEYEEVDDIVEPVVIVDYEELEDRVEPVITGECEEVEVATFVDSVEAVTTGDITECEKVEAVAYDGSVKAVGDICEHVGVKDIIYVDMVEAVAVRSTNESEEVEAVSHMNCVEHAAVGDIECIEVEADHFSDIDEIKENETINYMDSAEPEAGNTDDNEEVKNFTYVTSEVAVVVPDTGEPQSSKAFTSVDNAVAVPDIGESKNSGGDIINTAVESLVVSSQVTVESERALVGDDQLQRDDDATGESIVKSEETVEDEETVVSSGIVEEVFKTEDFIGITKLVRSEDCRPSEDTMECEDTLGSRDVTETLEAKQFGNQVWERVIDVSNEDLRESTIPEITRGVSLQHRGRQFQEQDCPGEVEGCCVGEDSEYASSHTLEHQDKQTELFTMYRDQPVAKTSSEVMHGSDGSDSSTGRETLDEKDKQPDIFTVCRDQPGVKTSPDVIYGSDYSTDQETLAMEDKQADLFTVYRDQPAVKTSPEVMYESHSGDSSTDQETLDKEDKQPDLFTVYMDQPLVKTSSEVMHGSDGGDSSTDRETLDKEDERPDIFTVCRDQPGVKTSPDVIYGSDDSDSSTDQETLDKEDKQPDLFTVYRDQLGVKTDSEVMYESDGDSLADQDTLNKEDKKSAEPCRIHTDHQPLAITSTENKNESDLCDTSRDMDDRGKRNVAIISREAVGYALPVCCAAKVLPEDE
ncbi:tudor domain-containing protein 6 isoform X3 [Rana temporaria]|uniref:tudor domain-containing protein 6 isoform X3 n=1 Tax=Rana temporaria TaxID=8407 RepID=UPI001AAC7D09|nr:tudor domain-containing protein 6 isoform X3 [Rana temporaria]